MSPGGAEAVLVAIGDISVTRTAVLAAGRSSPVHETVWTTQDRVVTRTRTPVWAVLLAVLLFPVGLLGLLFLVVAELWTPAGALVVTVLCFPLCALGLLLVLLIKRSTVSGWVEVTVSGPGLLHTTGVRVAGADALAAVHEQVDYVRTLVATARRQVP